MSWIKAGCRASLGTMAFLGLAACEASAPLEPVLRQPATYVEDFKHLSANRRIHYAIATHLLGVGEVPGTRVTLATCRVGLATVVSAAGTVSSPVTSVILPEGEELPISPTGAVAPWEHIIPENERHTVEAWMEDHSMSQAVSAGTETLVDGFWTPDEGNTVLAQFVYHVYRWNGTATECPHQQGAGGSG